MKVSKIPNGHLIDYANQNYMAKTNPLVLKSLYIHFKKIIIIRRRRKEKKDSSIINERI